MPSLGAPVRSQAQASFLFLSSFWDYISPNDFGNIGMNFENEFWLILCQEFINSKLFAISTDLWRLTLSSFDGPVTNCPCSRCRGPEFKSRVFFHEGVLGSLGSNLVFIIPFGI